MSVIGASAAQREGGSEGALSDIQRGGGMEGEDATRWSSIAVH